MAGDHEAINAILDALPTDATSEEIDFALQGFAKREIISVVQARADEGGGGGGVTDHGALTGLADNDHPQYALAADVPTTVTFNDHSARHEDGGADEISIQGLAGTPTELTNHLGDTSDAHDASAISVADAGGHFTGTDVEAALQELGAAGGSAAFVGVRVTDSSDQAITTATTTAVLFNDVGGETFDTDGFHDTSTNPERLTVPAGKAGYYRVWAHVRWETVTTGSYRRIGFGLNGLTRWTEALFPEPSGAGWTGMHLSDMIALAEGDYVVLVVDHDRGSNLNVKGSFAASVFGMELVGT